MSVDTYVRKAKINNSDYNNIANLPYKDQIEIFRTRSLNKYKQLNRMQSNKKRISTSSWDQKEKTEYGRIKNNSRSWKQIKKIEWNLEVQKTFFRKHRLIYVKNI